MTITPTPSADGRRARRAAERRPARLIRRLALATGGVALATALGIAGAAGTTALLNARAPLEGATITAGTMDLNINGAAVATLGTWQVTPAAPQARSFTVTNVSTVPVDLGASIATTSSTAITADTTARLTRLSGAATCTTGLAGTSGPLPGYAATGLGTLAAGQSATLCLEVGLRADTPVERSGQAAAFTLTVTSTQRAS